jgi:hypothetical protein
MKSKIFIILLLSIFMIGLTSASTCPSNIGVCDETKVFQNSIIYGGGNTYITYNGSSYNATYNMWAYNQTFNSTGYAQYQFANNNFNGSGNLTTTGIGTFGELNSDNLSLSQDNGIKYNNTFLISMKNKTIRSFYVDPKGRVAIGDFPAAALIPANGYLDSGINLYTSKVQYADPSDGSTTFRFYVDTGTYHDSKFQSARLYDSAFQFATPASATNQGFTIRGAGSASLGDKFGFWTDYPDDWFDVHTDSTFEGYTKLMNNVVVGDGNILGTEMLTNGAFTGNANNWILATGNWSYTSNAVNQVGDGNGALVQNSTSMISNITIGNTYKLQFTITNWAPTSSQNGRLNISAGGTQLPPISTDGIKTLYFTAVESNTNLSFISTGTTPRLTIDSISLKQVTGGNATIIGDLKVGNSLNVTGNVTINNLLQLQTMILPSCSSTYKNNIGANATGTYGCNSTNWIKIF